MNVLYFPFLAKSSGFQVNSNTSPFLRGTLLSLQTLWSFPVYFHRLLHMPSQEKHFIADTPVHQHRLLSLHCPGTHMEWVQKEENNPQNKQIFPPLPLANIPNPFTYRKKSKAIFFSSPQCIMRTELVWWPGQRAPVRPWKSPPSWLFWRGGWATASYRPG